MSPPIETIFEAFARRGGSLYGGEAVTQLEHALQSAALAERAGADEWLVAATLLHDIGHILHELPEDAPLRGIDDAHEERAGRWLAEYFPAEVVEPVRLHVAAKRYLCAVDPGYHAALSGPSRHSLELQGGPMSEAEVCEFQAYPCFERAVALRRWDDAAKVVGLATPDLAHFADTLEAALCAAGDGDRRP